MKAVRNRTSRIRQVDAGRFKRLRSVKATQKKLVERPLKPRAATDLSHFVGLYGAQLRQVLEPFELTLEGALCLQRVAQGCDTPTRLSQNLRTTPLRVAPLLNELELRGLVICQRELGEEGHIYLYSTEAGRELSGRVQEALATRLQGLGAGERQGLLAFSYKPATRQSVYETAFLASDSCDRRDALSPYLDSAGRLLSYPVQPEVKRLALAYLAEKFDIGRSYSEGEIRTLLERHHTFGSAALLQRKLSNEGLLALSGDGSVWWRV